MIINTLHKHSDLLLTYGQLIFTGQLENYIKQFLNDIHT